jgi:hypothetical protein
MDIEPNALWLRSISIRDSLSLSAPQIASSASGISLVVRRVKMSAKSATWEKGNGSVYHVGIIVSLNSHFENGCLAQEFSESICGVDADRAPPKVNFFNDCGVNIL